MIKKIHTPHDRLFHTGFKKKKNAMGFMEAYLPKSVLAVMDVAQLEVENTHFVDEALREYRSDLLYQVPLHNGKSAYIYTLFEHQSTPDDTMPLRLLGYVVEIWKYLQDKHKTQQLMPVIPLVLSQRKWLYSPRLQDMLAVDEETKAILAPFMPDLTHVLVDLSTLDMDSIRGSIGGKVLLHLLQSGQAGRFIEAFEQLTPLLNALAQEDTELIEALLRYAVQVAEEVSVDQLRDVVVKSLDTATGEKLMTIAEQIEQEVAAKYQHEIAQMAKEKEQALRKQEQALRKQEQAQQREQALEAQLRAAGIEPKH